MLGTMWKTLAAYLGTNTTTSPDEEGKTIIIAQTDKCRSAFTRESHLKARRNRVPPVHEAAPENAQQLPEFGIQRILPKSCPMAKGKRSAWVRVFISSWLGESSRPARLQSVAQSPARRHSSNPNLPCPRWAAMHVLGAVRSRARD